MKTVVGAGVFLLAAAGAARADHEFAWPVSGWITATWKYRWGETHTGSADIAAPHWTPITAAADGKVTSVSSGT
jgi:murein DD-endopeptidase MepM/ murein hydrolase activator NlpD